MALPLGRALRLTVLGSSSSTASKRAEVRPSETEGEHGVAVGSPGLDQVGAQ